jgi:hypothetical protein
MIIATPVTSSIAIIHRRHYCHLYCHYCIAPVMITLSLTILTATAAINLLARQQWAGADVGAKAGDGTPCSGSEGTIPPIIPTM